MSDDVATIPISETEQRAILHGPIEGRSRFTAIRCVTMVTR
jgi:hypothetical protein